MSEQEETATVNIENEDDDIFVLEDVKVDTLGLVERGAVDETFFLLKSQDQEGDMADKFNETDLTPLEQLGAERVQALLELGKATEKMEHDGKGKKKKPMRKMPSEQAGRAIRSLLSRYGDELPDDVMGMLAAMIEDDYMEMSEEKTEKDLLGDEVSKMEEKEVEVSADQDVAQKVSKGDQPAEGPTNEELLARIEKAEALEKAHAEMLARLEKAETDLAKAQQVAQQERQARQRIIHIEKAREFDGLALDDDKMGEFLHRLADQDQAANVEKAADADDRLDWYGYITGVLKAANEVIKESRFYDEVGSTATGTVNSDVDLIEKAKAAVKAGDYPDLATALVHASPDEQRAYLKTVREQ